MTRRDLERRLAERLEPEPGENEAIRESPEGLWYRSHRTGSSHLSYWIPRPFTTDGNAMLALVRAANAAGMRVEINCMPQMISAVCSPSNDLSGFATFAPTPMMAVATAVGRAVGVLGRDEKVTDD